MQPRSRTFLIDAAFVLAVAALLVVTGFVLDARADTTHAVTFQNTGTRPVVAVDLCIGDFSFRRFDVTCAAGATCESPIELPPGCYDVTLRAVVAAEDPSEPSNVLRNPAYSGAICADSDGNGVVNAIDFGEFLNAFEKK